MPNPALAAALLTNRRKLGRRNALTLSEFIAHGCAMNLSQQENDLAGFLAWPF
jgi:hypothetical protein